MKNVSIWNSISGSKTIINIDKSNSSGKGGTVVIVVVVVATVGTVVFSTVLNI